ncbi:CLUMA_CG007826, isoform A [Clunio marinus]|uniref:CLUMA_CG007826, isoform A n=1 Tax=Clunio marinus TaxID=568069 RepID=A0A1J1I1U1_9DIPT|nr:CLUMA_CG007826, isoform A [Clunio marinus]
MTIQLRAFHAIDLVLFVRKLHSRVDNILAVDSANQANLCSFSAAKYFSSRQALQLICFLNSHSLLSHAKNCSIHYQNNVVKAYFIRIS